MNSESNSATVSPTITAEGSRRPSQLAAGADNGSPLEGSPTSHRLVTSTPQASNLFLDPSTPRDPTAPTKKATIAESGSSKITFEFAFLLVALFTVFLSLVAFGFVSYNYAARRAEVSQTRDAGLAVTGLLTAVARERLACDPNDVDAAAGFISTGGDGTWPVCNNAPPSGSGSSAAVGTSAAIASATGTILQLCRDWSTRATATVNEWRSAAVLSGALSALEQLDSRLFPTDVIRGSAVSPQATLLQETIQPMGADAKKPPASASSAGEALISSANAIRGLTALPIDAALANVPDDDAIWDLSDVDPVALDEEFQIEMSALGSIIDSAVFQQAMRDEAAAERTYRIQAVILWVATLVLISLAVIIKLVVDRDRAHVEQRAALRGDFCIKTDSGDVVIAPASLKRVDYYLNRYCVMQHHDVKLSPTANQMELQMYSVKRTMEALRPFLPPVVFRRNKRAVGHEYFPAVELQIGIKRRFQAAIMLLGFRHFNDVGGSPAFDGSVLSTMLMLAHRAVKYFKGTVVQTSSEGIIALFEPRAEADDIDDEDDDSRIDADADEPARNASRTALAMLSSIGRSADSALAAVPVSIAVTSGMVIAGIIQTHVSRSFAVVADTLARALEMEPLNHQLGTCILADSETAVAIGDHAVVRPVAYSRQKKASIFEIVAEEPKEGTANYAESLQAYTRLHDQNQHWEKVWDKYEDAMEHSAPDKLEEVLKDLEDHRTLFMDRREAVVDVAYQRAWHSVRQALIDLGVTLDVSASASSQAAAGASSTAAA